MSDQGSALVSGVEFIKCRMVFLFITNRGKIVQPESPRWSHSVGTHVQTSIESVRVIDRLLLMARRHAGEAYRTRS